MFLLFFFAVCIFYWHWFAFFRIIKLNTTLISYIFIGLWRWIKFWLSLILISTTCSTHFIILLLIIITIYQNISSIRIVYKQKLILYKLDKQNLKEIFNLYLIKYNNEINCERIIYVCWKRWLKVYLRRKSTHLNKKSWNKGWKISRRRSIL